MKLFQPPKGTRDILLEEAAIRRQVIDRLRQTFLRFGFSDLDTPSFEHLETLQCKSGPEVADQIYSFEDKGGRKLGLIFEFTASLGRVAASHPELMRPFKRYQIGKVWRYESPQNQRYRELCQADIDIIGPYSMDCEAEILLVMADVLRSFGLNDFVFILNNRKALRAQLEVAGMTDESAQGTVLRGLDKLDKIGLEKVREYVLAHGISVEQYERFMALVPKAEGNDAILGELERNIGSNSAGREAVAELREILALTAEVGLAEAIRITPFLVRGLDYYTGSIFEVRSPALGNVSFGGGGRYDTMVETYGGQPAGAVGFAFGVERLISVLTEEKLVVGRKSEADVMLALSNPALAAHAFKLAAELRAAHVSVFQYVGEAKLGKQFSFASRMGFPFVVVVGEDELASGQFKLKNMTTGEETSVPRQELPACVVSLRPPTAGRNEIGRKE